MFHASVNDELYDMDRWGQYFRPNGMRSDNDSNGNSNNNNAGTSSAVNDAPRSNVSASSIMDRIAAKAPVQEEESAPTPAASSSEPKKMQTPDEILAAIRRRQQGK
jgi:hypothetical protein